MPLSNSGYQLIHGNIIITKRNIDKSRGKAYIHVQTCILYNLARSHTRTNAFQAKKELETFTPADIVGSCPLKTQK
jgi:hypothetical protein